MKTLTIYSYSKCSTCRKAINWLKSNQLEYELRDITLNPPEVNILLEAFNQLGNRKALFNTSGVSYRTLGAENIKAMNDDQALEALAKDGKLIKRPFLISSSGEILVGFNEKTWMSVLLG